MLYEGYKAENIKIFMFNKVFADIKYKIYGQNGKKRVQSNNGRSEADE